MRTWKKISLQFSKDVKVWGFAAISGTCITWCLKNRQIKQVGRFWTSTIIICKNQIKSIPRISPNIEILHKIPICSFSLSLPILGHLLKWVAHGLPYQPPWMRTLQQSFGIPLAILGIKTLVSTPRVLLVWGVLMFYKVVKQIETSNLLNKHCKQPKFFWMVQLHQKKHNFWKPGVTNCYLQSSNVAISLQSHFSRSQP